MVKLSSIFAFSLSMAIAGCNSISGQPKTNNDDVCSAGAPASIIGQWTVIGLNGRQLPEYFPQSSVWVSEESISLSSASTGARFTTQPNFIDGDEKDDFEKYGGCYSLEDGRLDIYCPSVGIVPARRYAKHQRSIYRIQDRISAVWANTPLYFSRLGNKLCARNDAGNSIEYLLVEE